MKSSEEWVKGIEEKLEAKRVRQRMIQRRVKQTLSVTTACAAMLCVLILVPVELREFQGGDEEQPFIVEQSGGSDRQEEVEIGETTDGEGQQSGKQKKQKENTEEKASVDSEENRIETKEEDQGESDLMEPEKEEQNLKGSSSDHGKKSKEQAANQTEPGADSEEWFDLPTEPDEPILEDQTTDEVQETEKKVNIFSGTEPVEEPVEEPKETSETDETEEDMVAVNGDEDDMPTISKKVTEETDVSSESSDSGSVSSDSSVENKEMGQQLSIRLSGDLILWRGRIYKNTQKMVKKSSIGEMLGTIQKNLSENKAIVVTEKLKSSETMRATRAEIGTAVYRMASYSEEKYLALLMEGTFFRYKLVNHLY